MCSVGGHYLLVMILWIVLPEFFDKFGLAFNANVTMYGAKFGYALASAKSCARSGFN